MMNLFRSKIYLALALMLMVLIFGVFGYRLIADYSWIDAFYMTIITVTTVGFSEVRPMGPEGKIFTVVLIITSVFILGFAISVITEYILSRNSVELLKKKKMKNIIKSLNNHVIICGFGRNGMQAAEKLRAYKKPFVVIEKDKEIIDRFGDDILFVEGDANDDEILLECGIERAQYLIAALPDDAANLFVVLSARQLKGDLFIISRASLVNSQKKLFF
ncbi:MAG: potassium channel family protein, partial [Maribacter sp.]